MAVLYFDTSALVRRYDWAEPGADRVRTLCRRGRGHTLVISRLTPVEIASAFNRKVREGVFSQLQRDRRWRLFRQHGRAQYRVIWPDEHACSLAERFLFTYRVRAYDAVQLAAALQGRALFGGLGDYRFCTADRVQEEAARSEALAVELIG